MANFEVLRIEIGLKFEHNGFLSDMPSAKVLLNLEDTRSNNSSVRIRRSTSF